MIGIDIELVVLHLIIGVRWRFLELYIHIRVLDLVHVDQDLLSLLLLQDLILLIPIIDIVQLLPFLLQTAQQHFTQLTVVGRLLKLIREDLLQERQQCNCLWGLTQHFGCHLVFKLLDPLELSFVKLLLIHILVLTATLLGEESQVAIDQVQQQVRKGDKVIATAVSNQVEAVAGGEYQITLKESFFRSLNVLSIFIYVLYSQSKIDYLYLM